MPPCLTLTKTVLNLRRTLQHKALMPMNNTNEHITHEIGNDEAWICICNNTSNAQGFYPCDREGNQMEPDAGWRDLYVCDRCGRIVDQKTLEVVGRNTSRTFAS